MNIHSVTPVRLSFTSGERPRVASALDALLKANGEQISQNGKTFALAAFSTPEEAQAAIAQPGERILIEKLPEFVNADNCVWVAVTSFNDPQSPAVLLRDVFHSEEVLLPLVARCESEEFSGQMAYFDSFVDAPSGSTAFRDAITELVLHELKDNMRSDLARLPTEERIDLEGRGDYVGEAFDVDPVGQLLTDPYALQHAADEANTDYIAETEHETICETIKNSWTNSAEEDLMPLLTELGHDNSAIEDRLREWCEECTAHTGVLDLKVRGTCAIAARPMLGKEGIYITFDGITSGAFNAVVDADYLAMLDVLNIDPRQWVDHLATIAGMKQPNWDIDLKAIVDGTLQHARFDPETGYHWEGEASHKAVKEVLLQAIFHLPPEQSTEITQEQLDAAAAARAAYRDAVKNDAPDKEVEALKLAYDQAMEATREQPGREDAETAEYLFDIALQALLADAENIVGKELQARGVDLDAMAAIPSSSDQLKAFPQLIETPNYYMALANLGSNGAAAAYDWKNPPNETPQAAPLISSKNLVSILENCNYSGNLVIAFTCDLDDLQKIGVAAQEGQSKEVRVDGAYVHIHDYGNGAGDGEPMQLPWTFNTQDLKNGTIVLRNDTGSSYGIQGVFGQFLADNCGIVISETAEPVKRLEVEPEPALP